MLNSITEKTLKDVEQHNAKQYDEEFIKKLFYTPRREINAGISLGTIVPSTKD